LPLFEVAQGLALDAPPDPLHQQAPTHRREPQKQRAGDGDARLPAPEPAHRPGGRKSGVHWQIGLRLAGQRAMHMGQQRGIEVQPDAAFRHRS